MAQTITEQRNLWGRQVDNGQGLEAQRLDLWQVSLKNVVNGLSFASPSLAEIPDVLPYYAVQVALPELRVKPEVFRRDSRSYQMPSWDDPCDAVRITFLMDAPQEGKASAIYRVLDAWRAVVRAGRGTMSNGYQDTSAGSPGKRLIILDSDYRINYAFNISLLLLRGGRATLRTITTSVVQQSTAIENDLEISGRYTLVRAWLGGFKMGDLNYAANGLVTVEATIYVEDIVDETP